MRHSGRIERHRPRSKNDPINQAVATCQATYRAACRHDGIPENSKFVIFSEANPFVQFINAAARELFARIQEYQSGGYVGLTIDNRNPSLRKVKRKPNFIEVLKNATEAGAELTLELTNLAARL